MRLLVLAAAVLVAGCDGEPGATSQPAGLRPPPSRPNIVFLFADDLGWGDVGFNDGDIRTPNIDRLAAGGVRLDQFYVLPVCTPSRAALLTGRYPIRYGLQEDVIRQWADYGLPADERTLGDALRQAGYFTAIVGKWHLGHCCPQYLPQNRGFDHQYGSYLGTVDYYEREFDGGYDWHRNGETLLEEGYNTDLIANEVCRLIESRDSGKPFFLYVPFTAPHTPLQAPQSYLDQYAKVEDEDRRTYSAMVASLDDAVGRIVATVEQAGLAANTLIVFCSDNGGSPQLGASNGPLRRGKRSLREGGIRVPAVVYWPGVLRGGSVVRAPLHVVDWYPTLVKLAGGALGQPRPLDGCDLWAALADGADSPHDDILLNANREGAAIRRGRWKLLRRQGEIHTKARLFDLERDPYEASDVAAEHADIVRDLSARLDAYAKAAAEPLAQPDQPMSYVPPTVWGP
jgi:arylsulfatase A-like enzyme